MSSESTLPEVVSQGLNDGAIEVRKKLRSSFVEGECKFADMINQKANELLGDMVDKGFYPPEKTVNFGEKVALIHSELSEALEAFRSLKELENMPMFWQAKIPDKHCPEYDNVTIEFADALIRILELCSLYNLPIGEAVIAKSKANKNRPPKHGKGF